MRPPSDPLLVKEGSEGWGEGGHASPSPLRGYGAEGSEGDACPPPGFCKAGEL